MTEQYPAAKSSSKTITKVDRIRIASTIAPKIRRAAESRTRRVTACDASGAPVRELTLVEVQTALAKRMEIEFGGAEPSRLRGACEACGKKISASKKYCGTRCAESVHVVAYEGRKYASISAAASELGFGIATFGLLRSQGHSVESAIRAALMMTTYGVEVDGVQYSTMTKAARAIGISPERVRKLMRRQGMNAQDAVDCIRWTGRVSIDGKELTSVADIATHLGWSRSNVWRALKANDLPTTNPKRR